MQFNINKYKKRKFHNDPDVDKKIKVLYLWLDYEIERQKLTYVQQLRIIDHWINNFIKHELYEVIPAFKARRTSILKIIALRRNAKKSGKRSLALYLRFYRMKIKKLFKRLFNNKK